MRQWQLLTLAAWRTTAAASIRKRRSRICIPAAPPAADNKDHKQLQGSVATLLHSHRKGEQRSCVSDFQVLQHALVDRVFRHQRQIQILLSHSRFMTTAVNSGEDPNKQMSTQQLHQFKKLCRCFHTFCSFWCSASGS